MKKRLWLGALCALLGSACLAQDEDLMSRMINKETNGTWYFQPDTLKARHFKVPELPGGFAFRVKAHQGANPWDVQASSPVAGAIGEGDVIMLTYYARAGQPAEGGSRLTARIQVNSPPWTAVLESTAPITEDWQSYCAFRVSNASIPENKSSVSIHLATAKQVIELGPVFVFNFGKGYPTNQLKGCDG